MASAGMWRPVGSSDGEQEVAGIQKVGPEERNVPEVRVLGDNGEQQMEEEQRSDDSDSLWRWLLTYMETALTWHRPGYSIAMFICCNALFWSLALTPWRLYSLVALGFLLLVVMENVKALVLFVMKDNDASNLNSSPHFRFIGLLLLREETGLEEKQEPY